MNVENRRGLASSIQTLLAVQTLSGIMQAWPAFLRVASKGVYAGGGSIAEGGHGCKPSGGNRRGSAVGIARPFERSACDRFRKTGSREIPPRRTTRGESGCFIRKRCFQSNSRKNA